MSKRVANHFKKIEIWWLINDHKRHDFKGDKISWGPKGEYGSVGYRLSLWNPSVRFFYTQTNNLTGEKKEFDYEVQLLKTPCHYGYFGRHWFQCPLIINNIPCGRRVGVLYKTGDYFGCRHCNDLTYVSKKKNRNSPYYSLCRILDLHIRLENMQSRIKRYTYQGKLTKKQRKINQLTRRLLAMHHIDSDQNKRLKML